MTTRKNVSALALCTALCAAMTTAACEQQEPTPAAPPPPSAASSGGEAKQTAAANPHGGAMQNPHAGAAQNPHGEAGSTPSPQNPHAGMSTNAPASGATIEGGKLLLTGISFDLAEEWPSEPIPPSPMAPKAVLKLPKAEGDADDGMIRITYFPNMRGMNDANIARWLGQVAKPDGSPYSPAEANLTEKELGDVKLTMVDLKGSVKVTMRAAPKAGSRMIGAIVDHPQGPHFVVISGGEATVAKWEEAARKFLESAKVR